MEKCIFCGNSAQHDYVFINETFSVECKTCGNYIVCEEFIADFPAEKKLQERKHILSGIIRERTARGEKTEFITTDVQDMLNSQIIPKDIFESIDRILLYIVKKNNDASEFFDFCQDDYPIAYAKNLKEFIFYLEKANDFGYLEKAGSSNGCISSYKNSNYEKKFWSTKYRLDLKGSERVKELENKQVELNKAINIKIQNLEENKMKIKCFIVHGHDEAKKQATARFIEKLGLEAIILHEQANKGKTIIEKFEEHSNDVDFAIVLLTPDDKGGLAKEPYNKYKFRGRQNVIFELGFFLGSLGRNKVCALFDKNIEIPSDYQGVVFIPFDEKGAWKFQLAKEMKAAKLDIDMNNAI